MPFGGGATDAAEFSRAGIEATSIIGLESNWIRTGIDYHTSRDTVDKVDPNAVQKVLELAVRYSIQKDNL